MDHDDLIPGSYTLEVTSPGLERKLRRREHYRKSLGREIKVKTQVAVEGSRTHRGDLVSATERGFTVDVGDSERYINYDDVASARTVFVWSAKAGQNS
jgi:ribosome maturation factor RimP